MTRPRKLGLLALTLTVLMVQGVAPATAATTYNTNTPFAIWEVPYAQLGEVKAYKANLLVKSFSPGMNVVRYLDAVRAQGKRAIVYFTNTVDYGAGTVYPSRVKAWVDQVKSHPGLYGYLSVKEPSWSGITLSEMRSLYKAFKAADPNHRVIALLGDTPHFGTSRNPWGTGVANTLWVNWYPVWCSRGYVTGAATHFPKVRAYVNKVTPGTPIWLMVQGHTYYKGDKCTPTKSQLSRQVREGFSYLKANGIIFHTWHFLVYDKDIRRTPHLRDHIHTIIRQVRAGTF